MRKLEIQGADVETVCLQSTSCTCQRQQTFNCDARAKNVEAIPNSQTADEHPTWLNSCQLRPERVRPHYTKEIKFFRIAFVEFDLPKISFKMRVAPLFTCWKLTCDWSWHHPPHPRKGIENQNKKEAGVGHTYLFYQWWSNMVEILAIRSWRGFHHSDKSPSRFLSLVVQCTSFVMDKSLALK